jgi:hypothetical protein
MIVPNGKENNFVYIGNIGFPGDDAEEVASVISTDK